MSEEDGEIDSMRIGTQMMARNLSGFIEGYKEEHVTVDEFQAFLEFTKPRVEDEFTVDAIEEIIAYLDKNNITISDDDETEWFQIVEDFYEEWEEEQ